MTLPNSCSTSELSIFPPNWKSSKADIKSVWYVDFRFKDPRFIAKYPNGKQFRLKSGLNRLKTLKEKQAAVELIRNDMLELLKAGFNPITDNQEKVNEKTPIPAELGPITEVLPSTPFVNAFRFSLSISENVKETKSDTKSVLNSIEKAAITLGYLAIPISELEVRHIKLLLDQCHKSNSKFSAKRFNKAKSYLSGLFRYLVEVGAAHGNMALAISPMREKVSEQVHFTNADVEKIKNHLWTNNRPFYNFMMMFYYSGGRIKEFMRLQGKHVDLVEQTYKTLVKKGNKPKWTERTIRNNALHLWKDQMVGCGPEDYVFSVNLLPGSSMIDSKQVTRRWMTHVKKPLSIEPTFYKLKHRNAEKTLEKAGAKMAAGQMGHTSTRMAEEVYAFNEKKRIHEGLKELDIDL